MIDRLRGQIVPTVVAAKEGAARVFDTLADAMVTSQEMRLFALDCLRWSEENDNPGHRDLMIRIARTWMNTASAIERRVSYGDELVSDLRVKLD